jgi:hypothetical protein
MAKSVKVITGRNYGMYAYYFGKVTFVQNKENMLKTGGLAL